MASTKADDKKLGTTTLDDAMLHTGFGLFNVVMMLLSGLVLMGMIMETMGLSYVIPAAHCDLQLTQAQKGWLAAIPFIGIIITSHMWGWLADTRGRRPVMLFSMAVSCVVSALSSLSPNLLVFAILRFIAAIFISGPSAVCYAYLGEFNSTRHRDRMVAFGAAFVGIGTVVLPAVSWLILPLEFDVPLAGLGVSYRPWRLLVVAFAVPYALSALALLYAPESPKFLCAVGRTSDALAVVRRIYAVNKWTNPDSFPVSALECERVLPAATAVRHSGGARAVLSSMADQTAPLFRAPLLPYTLLACFVQFGIFATANGFYIWFPNILNQLSNHADQDGAPGTICEVLSKNLLDQANHTESGLASCDDSVNVATYYKAIMMGLVFCSMYVLAGVLVDWVGKRAILVGVLGAAGACGIAASAVRDLDAAVALFGVFQMCGACIGMMTAVVVELFPTNLRAMAVSLSMMTGRVGSVLGSNLIGWLIRVQCPLSFYLFGGLLILCSALCVTLPKGGKSVAGAAAAAATAAATPDSSVEASPA